MGKPLVIVESPAKARTLSRFLSRDYQVKASVGHIRDLPRHRLGIDLEHDFQPEFITIPGKSRIIAELRQAAAGADRILLAADPDREGEAICWHLAEVLQGENDRIQRILFHEITNRAVTEALQNPLELDQQKVDAQFARRTLDRLVGYRLSPLLWKKLRRGLSAGRVQSVALRILVDREREIEAFLPEEYWVITALAQGKEPPPFTLKLSKTDGRKAAVKDRETAEQVTTELREAELRVANIQRKKQKQRPVPPFITSTLQQEAARKLRFTAQRSMKLAQGLYEGRELGEHGRTGLITYMRTDSPRVSEESLKAVREHIQARFGKEYLPTRPVQYSSKKGAQDAHEAIRPTSMEQTPEVVQPHLGRDEFRLYRLIWNRFVASQMKPAELEVTRVDVAAGRHELRVEGSVVLFPGFRAVYSEGKDDAPATDRKGSEQTLLPALMENEILKTEKIESDQRFTKPPPRYTEATLVKALEEKGIGRPSTYATILSILRDREYARMEQRRFQPTTLGKAVADLLVQGFPELLDEKFTARLEGRLDRIEEGSEDWRGLVGEFYESFNQRLIQAEKELPVLRDQLEATEIPCPDCGQNMAIKRGRAGQFLACTRYPECKGKAEMEIGPKGEIKPILEKEVVKPCPACGADMVVRNGRFGRFLACTGYPECKQTEPIGTGVACPLDGCDGELVERRSRGGRRFYSCSRYPACRHTVWSRPVAKPCPVCGHPFLVLRASKDGTPSLSCPKKGCTHREDPPEESVD